ncbi:MAG TPA: bifunctional demethylmenaquinone methyltransferase/2-methoxy-6-polyprenyl-1,4-benzoquinol methylase UbiE [Chloroflexia bacterium]|nr:bifunctional demethylmenaquinone methyltransferase/2-methoxy-6-polyprenyl-1,4-benzoquinol methylase UbiE [Chloroflexia bacterium]
MEPVTEKESSFEHRIESARLKEFKPETKAEYVNRMFAQIAPTYDLVNRIMTFGLDQGWRKVVVAEAAPPPGGRALDVATGTGDIALALAPKVGPDGEVVASDFCLEMMLPGPPKAEKAGFGSRIRWVAADALRMPFPDNSFDCVTTGFAMRNVVDIEQAFRDMCRVVKPGGRVVCLEVARPRFALVRWGHQFYFNRLVPLVGRIISRHHEAYTYLPDSARNFPQPEELKKIMERAGLTQVRFKRYGLGAVAIHVGVKP